MSIASSKLSVSVSFSIGTGKGICDGSMVVACGFLALEATVEATTLVLMASCKFLVVHLNSCFAGCTWDEPCTACTLLGFAFPCKGVGLEILNNFFKG